MLITFFLKSISYSHGNTRIKWRKYVDHLDDPPILGTTLGWGFGDSWCNIGYKSLNDNLKLILLTRAFKQNSHPKMSGVYCGTLISLP
jgi:hypothetical protein